MVLYINLCLLEGAEVVIDTGNSGIERTLKKRRSYLLYFADHNNAGLWPYCGSSCGTLKPVKLGWQIIRRISQKEMTKQISWRKWRSLCLEANDTCGYSLCCVFPYVCGRSE